MSSREPRIGVFVCHCGLNIAKSVDVKALREYASKLHGVVYAIDYEFMCSETGQRLIKESIKNHGLNRVVVASCSPKLHELTFRRVLSEAGLNPFLLEMANIREQCSWAYLFEPAKATEKARHIVCASVGRSRFLEEIGDKEEPVKPSALVVGAGVAGIHAALGLADIGFQVHIIEKNPFIGGIVAKLGNVFPTEDCGICIAPYSSEMHRKCLYKQQLINNPLIKLYTLSKLKSLSGYVGNFKAQVVQAPRRIDERLCIGCSKCTAVCPVEVPNEYDLGLSKRKAVYVPFLQAAPHAYVIDGETCTKCRKCVEVCPTNAISLEQNPSTIDLEVGTVVVAVGFEEFEPLGLFGFGKNKDVITQLKLARMIDKKSGGEEIWKPSNGKPAQRIVMIQCVGSRDKGTHAYCSKICCMIALKHARTLKKADPDLDLTICYKDVRLPGRNYERYYTDCQELGVKFLWGDVTKVEGDADGPLRLDVDLATGGSTQLDADLVVLSSALTPSNDTLELSRILNLTLSPDGFFMEQHPKLAPIDTNIDGIYICGACQGPKDIPETIDQAIGAVARAAIPMIAGKIKIDLAKAIVDEDLCIGCANCAAVCPYNAIEMAPRGTARVIEAVCKGCGTCVVECPASAIQLRHFSDRQVLAAVEGILAED